MTTHTYISANKHLYLRNQNMLNEDKSWPLTFFGDPWTPGLPTTFLSGVFWTPARQTLRSCTYGNTTYLNPNKNTCSHETHISSTFKTTAFVTCRHGSTLLWRQTLRQKLLLPRQKLLLLLCHNLDKVLLIKTPKSFVLALNLRLNLNIPPSNRFSSNARHWSGYHISVVLVWSHAKKGKLATCDHSQSQSHLCIFS